MPDKTPVRKRVSRPNPHNPAAELGRFIGICADARKQLAPENLKRTCATAFADWMGGLDQDSRDLIADIASTLRRPR